VSYPDNSSASDAWLLLLLLSELSKNLVAPSAALFAAVVGVESDKDPLLLPSERGAKAAVLGRPPSQKDGRLGTLLPRDEDDDGDARDTIEVLLDSFLGEASKVEEDDRRRSNIGTGANIGGDFGVVVELLPMMMLLWTLPSSGDDGQLYPSIEYPDDDELAIAGETLAIEEDGATTPPPPNEGGGDEAAVSLPPLSNCFRALAVALSSSRLERTRVMLLLLPLVVVMVAVVSSIFR